MLSICFTINAKEIRTIIGIIGNVVTFLITLSYMPKVIEIYKKKSVEDFQQHRHVVMVVKCCLWFVYGLPVVQKEGILVATSNGVALVLEVIYVVVFLISCNEDQEERKGTTWVCLMFMLYPVVMFYLVTLCEIETLSARRQVIGVVCTVYTIIMHAFLTVKTMEETESYCRFMSFRLSFVNFINAGIWTAYSLIYKIDIYILIFNGLGALACACLLIVMCFSTDGPCLLRRKTIPPSANNVRVV